MKTILDPKKTSAILVGTTKYKNFNSIAAVENNLNEFANVLADNEIFGLLPDKNIFIIKEETDQELKESLIKYTKIAKNNGIETLIIYFSGHGFRNREGKYFIATKNSDKELIRLDNSSALPYETVKSILRDSGITQKIVLIDACYSGSAAQGEGEKIFEEYKAKGTYTLTSSDSNELSFFDTDSTHTIFTGELLNILKNGLPNIAQEVILLSDLYYALREAVKLKQPKMTPQQLASKEITGDNFLFFKNKKFDYSLKTRELIQEGDNALLKSNIDLAKLKYYEAEKSISPINNKANLQAEIDSKLKICNLFNIIEEQVRQKIENNFDSKMEKELEEKSRVIESEIKKNIQKEFDLKKHSFEAQLQSKFKHDLDSKIQNEINLIKSAFAQKEINIEKEVRFNLNKEYEEEFKSYTAKLKEEYQRLYIEYQIEITNESNRKFHDYYKLQFANLVSKLENHVKLDLNKLSTSLNNAINEFTINPLLEVSKQVKQPTYSYSKFILHKIKKLMIVLKSIIKKQINSAIKIILSKNIILFLLILLIIAIVGFLFLQIDKKSKILDIPNNENKYNIYKEFADKYFNDFDYGRSLAYYDSCLSCAKSNSDSNYAIRGRDISKIKLTEMNFDITKTNFDSINLLIMSLSNDDTVKYFLQTKMDSFLTYKYSKPSNVYGKCDPFKNGISLVHKRGKTSFINNRGVLVVKFDDWNNGDYIQNSNLDIGVLSYVIRPGRNSSYNKFVLINSSGIISDTYHYIVPTLTNGKIKVCKNGKCGTINEKGVIIDELK